MFSWFQKNTWPELSPEEIQKRARLLVIDDSDFAYLSLFERDGYTMEKWADVTDLQKLESGYYDVVLLDLQGVGREQSNEQGLGVLRHIRRAAPAQVIIAYSSADWSLKYQEFFVLADAVLPKSADYVDFKRTVDNLLKERFSIGFYIQRIQSLVGGYGSEPEKIDALVRSAILDNSPKKLQKYLATKSADPQVISKVLDIIKIGVGIASLWKHS